MPDKSRDAFRTISEVAEWLGVQPHVLRFWESKFSQVKPVKRAGGRRYYRPGDMLLLGGIRKLLHDDGLTIKGAQKVLREEGMAYVAGLSQPVESDIENDLQKPDPVKESAEVVTFETQDGALSGTDTPQTFADDATDQAPGQLSDTATSSSSASETFDDAPSTDQYLDSDVAAESSPETADDVSMPSSDASAEGSPSLPSFLSGSSTSMADTAPERITEEDPGSASLPSFMRSDPPKPDLTQEGQDTAHAPQETVSEPPAESVVTPEAPRAHTVHAPDPDESTLVVHPSALSAAFSLQETSHQMVADVTPLVAQLAALRDRMAAERGR